MTVRKHSVGRRGPEPERVKIEGMDWQDAVRSALQKPRPAAPKPKRKKRK